MNATELRAAANRIRRIRACVEKSQDIYGITISPGRPPNELHEAASKVKRLMLDDERALVDYAISTIHADDDEPVTAEWLESLGFHETRTLPFGILLASDMRLEAYLYDGALWEITAWISSYGRSAERSHSADIPQPKTRVDVRRLLSALGIEVKHA